MRTADSTSSHRSVHRSQRSWTREELQRKLEILGPEHDPLPSTLPPSPPVSRSNSPAPTAATKRKLPSSSEQDYPKRQRTSSIASDRPTINSRHPPQPSQPHPHHLRPPTHIPPTANRNEPCEDGELQEEPPVASSSRPAAPSSSVPSSMTPIRRPKRGKTGIAHHEALHEKYHDIGRKLKYSGDARFWSTYPTTHKEYRPLINPPPPNTPYHTHGGLIARLELVEALVCFTYAIWNKDYGRKICNRQQWDTITPFLHWCRTKWVAEDVVDAEKAFIGLIFMLEGFVFSRRAAFIARELDNDLGPSLEDTKTQIAIAASKAEQDPTSSSGTLAPKSQPTPPTMLPSPASIAPANSANSTPITHGNGTPNTSVTASSGSESAQKASYHGNHQRLIPPKMLPDHYRDSPIPPLVMDAMASTKASLNPGLLITMKEMTHGTTSAGSLIGIAQQSLNLATIARFFPQTFSRMVHTSLSPTDEHEPDFEDDVGELFWPGQCINGEGLGWVCLMGKAMIKEFGKNYGYRGLDGVIPKPKPGEEEAYGPSSASNYANSGAQRPGSTPHGHTPYALASHSNTHPTAPIHR